MSGNCNINEHQIYFHHCSTDHSLCLSIYQPSGHQVAYPRWNMDICDLWYFCVYRNSMFISSWPLAWNIQCAQFFIRAHFCKNMGEIRALFWQKYGRYTGENTGKIQVFVILSSFCDLVHVQSVIDLFDSSITVTRWTCTKSPKYGQNHKNTGVIRTIFHKCPARPYKYEDLCTLHPFN